MVDHNNAFITLVESLPAANAVAVKDIIDVVGLKTTAGCAVVGKEASPAERDAACVEVFRAAGIRIVGKTNLHELAFGTTGINSWAGTPVNPLGRTLIPGGSSSGNAVALALGMCQMAVGTDTGGSVRIPAACCGVAGLKTTFGLVPVRGVRPLAPSLDVVGPMARNVEGIARAMALLSPAMTWARAPSTIYRLRLGSVDRRVDEAIDGALKRSGLEPVSCPISEDDWEAAVAAVNDILWAEAALSNLKLAPSWSTLQTGTSLVTGLAVSKNRARMRSAEETRRRWQDRLCKLLDNGVLVSPTIECLPPSFDELKAGRPRLARFTSPVNLAGLPALALPIPRGDSLPSSIQLVGPPHGEGMLLALARRIETACGDRADIQQTDRR